MTKAQAKRIRELEIEIECHTARHFCSLDLSGEWNAKPLRYAMETQWPVLLEVGRKGASR